MGLVQVAPGIRLPNRALRFDIGNLSNLNLTSVASITNLAAGTIAAWVKPLDISGFNNRIWQKAGGANNWLLIGTDSNAGDLRFGWNRSVTSLNIRTTGGYLALGEWQMVAAAWNSTGANSDQHIYRGTLTSPVTEASTYASQVVGSGTHDDTGGNPLILSTNTSIVGAYFQMWNRQLNVQELELVRTNPQPSSGGSVISLLVGDNGVTKQWDLSGTGNDASIGNTVLQESGPAQVAIALGLGTRNYLAA